MSHLNPTPLLISGWHSLDLVLNSGQSQLPEIPLHLSPSKPFLAQLLPPERLSGLTPA